MEWTWAQYLPDPITALDERASPMRHRRNPITMDFKVSILARGQDTTQLSHRRFRTDFSRDLLGD